VDKKSASLVSEIVPSASVPADCADVLEFLCLAEFMVAG